MCMYVYTLYNIYLYASLGYTPLELPCSSRFHLSFVCLLWHFGLKYALAKGSYNITRPKRKEHTLNYFNHFLNLKQEYFFRCIIKQ